MRLALYACVTRAAQRSFLDRAGEILVKKGDLQAGEHFQYLVGTCLECRGAVSPRIIELGNQLLERFRREQSPDAVPPSDVQGNPADPRILKERADRLEAKLISVQAVEDFGRAMDLAAAVSDPAVRYQAYLQMVEQIVR